MIERFIDYWGGWRGSMCCAVSLLLTWAVWWWLDRPNTGIALVGAIGWWLLATRERKDAQRRDGGGGE